MQVNKVVVVAKDPRQLRLDKIFSDASEVDPLALLGTSVVLNRCAMRISCSSIKLFIISSI